MCTVCATRSSVAWSPSGSGRRAGVHGKAAASAKKPAGRARAARGPVAVVGGGLPFLPGKGLRSTVLGPVTGLPGQELMRWLGRSAARQR